MSPLVYVVLVLVAIIAALIVGYVALLDRADALRARRTANVPTIAALPIAVAIPTAHRRKHPRSWS